MIVYPNCKINIGLQVVGRRADGYHDLCTIFLPVHSLHDELEITELHGQPEGATSDAVMLQEGLALDSRPEDNLCLRAWQLLHANYGIPPVQIRLKKGIPFGAGLGGGSSDAAFTLKVLNKMYGLNLGATQLEGHAAKLGADCAFFVNNQAAYATGIGDQLCPLPQLSSLDTDYTIQVAIPEGEHVNTREAYAGLDTRLFGTAHPDLRQAIQRPVAEWRNTVVNDFEASVFPNHPAIAELKAEMYRRGALYASMTGSGAAVFGIFKHSTL